MAQWVTRMPPKSKDLRLIQKTHVTGQTWQCLLVILVLGGRDGETAQSSILSLQYAPGASERLKIQGQRWGVIPKAHL